jgi:hypothetical protein
MGPGAASTKTQVKDSNISKYKAEVSIAGQDIDRVARLEQRIVTIERLLADQGRRLGVLERWSAASRQNPAAALGAQPGGATIYGTQGPEKN